LFYDNHKNHEDVSQEKFEMNFRKFTWRLVDDFRNFCMCDETEKAYRKLEEVIGSC